jgi:hypothetical protein
MHQAGNVNSVLSYRSEDVLTLYWIVTATNPLLFALMISLMSCVPSPNP